MTWLPFNENPENAPQLPAGIHTVKLVKLEYLDSTANNPDFQKVLATFRREDGAEYTEFLGTTTEGQLRRLVMFLLHLFKLCGLVPPAGIEFPADLPSYARAFIATGKDLQLQLISEEYQGTQRSVLAGRFDHCLTVASTPESF